MLRIDRIEELSQMMRANGIKALEYKDHEEEVKIELMASTDKEALPAPSPVLSNLSPAAEETADTVTAPVMGLVYTIPQNGSKPFVSVGDKIKKGSVLCVIEVMKVMNEITAAYDCEIAKICVENGNIVEFGQALFKVKKAGASYAR